MKRMCFIVLLIMACIFSSSCIETPGKSITLTIDHTKVSEQLCDFPVLIHLGKSSGITLADTSFVFTEPGDDVNRKKITVMTSKGEELYTEIEKWDSNEKEAWLWVKVPVISNVEDTILYLRYGKNRADNKSTVGDIGSIPAQNVWSNGYVMVLHMREDGKGIAGEYMDSTGRGNNGQSAIGLGYNGPEKVKSRIGYGQYFSNADTDWISVTDSDDLSITTTGELTVSFWLKNDISHYEQGPAGVSGNTVDYYIPYIEKGGGRSDLNEEWQFIIYNDPYGENPGQGNPFRYYNYSPSGGQGPGDYYGYGYPSAPGSFKWKRDEWYYMTGMTSCTDSSHGIPRYYLNDAEYTGSPESWENYRGFSYVNGPETLKIGYGRALRGGYGSIEGQIDEIQISNVLRNAAWIKTSYYSQRDALVTFIYK